MNLPSIPEEEYISDILNIADEFYDASEFLLKEALSSRFTTEFLDPAGYLASHAAELYIRALITGYTGYLHYEKLKNMNHNINKMLNILISVDNEAVSLKTPVERINKFSGDKVRYSPVIENPEVQEFGSDDVKLVKIIRGYAHSKMY